MAPTRQPSNPRGQHWMGGFFVCFGGLRRSESAKALASEIAPLAKELSPAEVKAIARYIDQNHAGWMEELRGSEEGITIPEQKSGLARALFVYPEGPVGILLGSLGLATKGEYKELRHAVAVIWDGENPTHPHALDAVQTAQRVASHERQIQNERDALLGLAGKPHVVRAFGACISREREPTFFTLQEYCREGDLLRRWAPYYRDPNRKLDDNFKTRVMSDVLDGLVEVHDSGRVHLDIKLENILLSGPSGSAKVGDFGFAELCTPNHKPSAFAGSPGYISPEAIRAHLAGRRIERTPKDDVFSLGVVFHCLEYNDFPFFSTAEVCEDLDAHLTMMASLDERAMVDHGLATPEERGSIGALIRAMLSLDPDARPDSRAARTWFHELHPALAPSGSDKGIGLGGADLSLAAPRRTRDRAG